MPKARRKAPTRDHENVISPDISSLDGPNRPVYALSDGARAPSIQPNGKPNAMNDLTDSNSTEAGKKSRNLKYTHRNTLGEVQDEFNADARSVIVTVIASGESVETRLTDFIDQTLVDAIAATDGGKVFLQATLFGLKTTEGNSCAQATKMGWGPEDMLKALTERRETLVDDKEWRDSAGGGPRTGHIVDAVQAMLERETGKPLNPAGISMLKEQVKANPKSFTDNPAIAAEITAAEMRRVEEKLKKKQAAAAAAGGTSFLSDLAASLSQG